MTELNKILLNCALFILHFLKIRDKNGNVIPFRMNKPQKRLYEIIRQQWKQGKPVRIIILKARQMGFSTLTEAIIFWLAATAFNIECMIVAHTDEATRNLFAMSKRFYEHLPEQIKPQRQSSNAQELVFDKPTKGRRNVTGLNSRIRIATAGGKGIGRSSTLTAVHASEFAWWPGDKLDTLIGLLQAVPDRAGTLVVIESTANGYDEFKKQWDKAVKNQRDGVDGFIPVFFAWYEMDEYRRPVPPGFQRTEEEEALSQTFGLDDEQLAWRRWCIENNCGGDLNKFRQEYPATPDEAFIATGDCVFDKEKIILRRRQVEDLHWERGIFRVAYDGLKVSVLITNNLRPIGDWVGDGTAYIRAWHKYLHNEGAVWFSTGNSSPVAFNALKKNSIQVCPISAQQWIGGAWVDKTAQTYLGSKWCDWLTDVPFFANGTFNTAQFGAISGSYNNTGGVLRLGNGSTVSHGTAVDVSNHKTVEVVISTFNYGNTTISVLTESGSTAASLYITASGTHKLDITSLKGKHFLKLYCQANGGNDYTDVASVKILV